MTSASSSVQEKVAPSTLALKLGNSFPPSISLAAFELLPQFWSSEQIIPLVSKSVCVGILVVIDMVLRAVSAAFT